MQQLSAQLKTSCLEPLNHYVIPYQQIQQRCVCDAYGRAYDRRPHSHVQRPGHGVKLGGQGIGSYHGGDRLEPKHGFEGSCLYTTKLHYPCGVRYLMDVSWP